MNVSVIREVNCNKWVRSCFGPSELSRYLSERMNGTKLNSYSGRNSNRAPSKHNSEEASLLVYDSEYNL